MKIQNQKYVNQGRGNGGLYPYQELEEYILGLEYESIPNLDPNQDILLMLIITEQFLNYKEETLA